MMLQQQPEPSSQPSPSPSFSSYSASETLADIAARVITELRLVDDDDDPFIQPWEDEQDQNDNEENQNDEEFEFAFVSRDENASSPVSADDIFCNGQIRPLYMYPIFNAPYLNDAVSQAPSLNSNRNDDEGEESAAIRRRLPLRKLMFEERETASTCSSPEAESVEGVAAEEGTYCVWNPNAAVARDRKKSNSTGSSSSKRWKLRELLLRSLSDGKAKKINSGGGNNSSNSDGDGKKRGFVFGATSKRTSRVAAAKPGSGDDGSGALVERVGKKSVWPYKQELVGLFASVNGLGRNLHPF